MAPNLFTPIQIGSLELKNRVFMAPLTCIRTGPSHVPYVMMKEYYTQRASAGLIIAEGSMMAPNTSAFIGEPGIYTPEQFAAWKEITDSIHAKGGKIFMQIWHDGRAAHHDRNDGIQAVAPSPIAINGEVRTHLGKKKHAEPREMTENEIASIVELFATAAKNSIDIAGFDGVEVHAANGYLIDQFLRTSSNIRTDQYGGSLVNRTRFLKEVLKAVTEAVGADKVGVRFPP